MNVLISGGAGFIGGHVTRTLKRRGIWVRWLDTFDPQIHGERGEQMAGALAHADPLMQADDVCIGDVRERRHWLDALDGIDAVIHLAAQTGTSQSMYRVHYYTDVNIGGTAQLWDCLANEKLNVQRVVVASSRSIYGEGAYACQAACGTVVPLPRSGAQLAGNRWEPRCPHCGAEVSPMATAEGSRPQPASLYAATKLSQETLSLTMGQALGIETSVLRFQNVYGPGQSLRNPYTGIISIFSNQLRQNIPLNIYEDGRESRDFVYVADVARVCANALQWSSSSGPVNVGSGQPTDVIGLAHMLKTLWQSDSPIQVTGDYRIGDIRHGWADVTQLAALESGWSPTPLEAGLKAFVTWATTQPVYVDRSVQALQELKTRNL